jgi:hypothetical protein
MPMKLTAPGFLPPFTGHRAGMLPASVRTRSVRADGGGA